MKALKIFSAVLFSLLMAGAFGVAGLILGVNPTVPAIVGGALSLIPTKEGVFGIKLGTLTTGVGVVTSFDLPYTPEIVKYTAATQLTGFKCEVYGHGVTIDLDATGLTAVGRHRIVSVATNMYKIHLADGGLKNRPCKLTFTNSAAQTPDIFVTGNNEGNILILAQKDTILLNSGKDFEKFAALFLPSLAAGDKVTTVYEDTWSQIDEREDLEGYSLDFQYTSAYVVDNLAGAIKTVNVLAAATQTAYILRYKQAA